MKELIWLQLLFGEVFVRNDGIPSLFCDNQSAIKLIKNPEFHKRTKHIDIKYHFILENGFFDLHQHPKDGSSGRHSHETFAQREIYTSALNGWCRSNWSMIRTGQFIVTVFLLIRSKVEMKRETEGVFSFRRVDPVGASHRGFILSLVLDLKFF